MEFRQSFGQRSEAQTEKNVDFIRQLLSLQVKGVAEGISPMQELKLKYQKDNEKDINELRDILSRKLTYPSSYVAESHMKANRLGSFDLKQKRQQGDWETNKITQDSVFCSCCGLIEQQQTLSIKTDIKNVNHIGVSTYMYFLTIKHLIMLLLIMFLVFSGYALITNLAMSSMYKNSLNDMTVSDQSHSFDSILAASLGSKALFLTGYGRKTYQIQCWLGVTMIVIWAICLVIIKYREQRAELQVDYDSKTAGDYTLLFKNFPKNMSLVQLERQLQEYLEKIRQTRTSIKMSENIKVMKINKATPFYLQKQNFDTQDLEEVDKQYKNYKKTFIKWIQQRREVQQFSTNQQERKRIGEEYNTLTKQRLELYTKAAQQVIQKMKRKNDYSDTVPAFVTFNNSYNKQFLQEMHSYQTLRFLHKISCFGKKKLFHYEIDSNKVLAIIQPASQPQDVMWTNLGQDQFTKTSKKLFTYGVTAVILCASFWAIYGLSFFQLVFFKNKTQNNLFNQATSIFISLLISAINIAIKQTMRILTVLQRNQTFTKAQTSLGLKAVLALLLNSILIPIMVNKFLKSNIYGVNGLAEDVFYLSITNSFLTPILKIFDGSYYFTRFLKWYYNRPTSKLSLNQNQLNDHTQYMQFQIGYEYIYIVNLFLFTCFFVSLQPIIPVFAMGGMISYYWAMKFSLFNRSRRPTPGNHTVNTAMYQLIFLGPMMYTIGSLCWSDFLSSMTSGRIPNIVALIISGVIFILPYKSIIQAIIGENPQPNLVFQEDRIFLPSEYDRMNPSTTSEGVKDYLDYIAEYKKKIASMSKEQLAGLQLNFMRQCGMAHRKNQTLVPSITNFFGFQKNKSQMSDQILIKQLLGGGDSNAMNPLIIGSTVMNLTGHQSRFRNTQGSQLRNNGLPFNMAVQNWLTVEETNRASYGNHNQAMNPFLKIVQGLNTNPEIRTSIKQQKNDNIDPSGGLTMVFGNFLKENHEHGFNQNTNPDNQIPLNIPLNIFGNLLNTNVKRKNNSWQQWGTDGAAKKWENWGN